MTHLPRLLDTRRLKPKALQVCVTWPMPATPAAAPAARPVPLIHADRAALVFLLLLTHAEPSSASEPLQPPCPLPGVSPPSLVLSTLFLRNPPSKNITLFLLCYFFS